jgi:classical protein kinase C
MLRIRSKKVTGPSSYSLLLSDATRIFTLLKWLKRKKQLVRSGLSYAPQSSFSSIVSADPSAPANTIGDRKGNLRKPLTGTLQITVKGAKELEHALLPKKSNKIFNETTIILKIEGNPRAKSHPSRTDKWNQDFELSVEKANELTIAIYDKHGNEMPAPIGFTWIRLSDLVDALRRQKIGMEAAGGGWVTADGAMNNPGGYGGQGRFEQNPYQLGGDGPLMPGGMGGGGMGGGGGSEGIEAWFIVEPAGAILLHLNFGEPGIWIRTL